MFPCPNPYTSRAENIKSPLIPTKNFYTLLYSARVNSENLTA